jgi:tripartite-type tricarboxylate transporter receptor subunit TctC
MPDAIRSFRTAGVLWLAGAVLAQWAHAETDIAKEYPKKPIRFIVPAVAGGISDNVGRAVARKLSETWGQQVIVDNRGGAAGTVGVDLTARAPADGYTVLLLNASHTVDAAATPKGPYDLSTDFAAVSKVTTHFLTMYLHPAIKVGSVSELVAHARANPGRLAYGSTGVASLHHFAWELFGHMAGVKLVHVPYKGGAHAMTAALAGDIQIGFASLLSLRPYGATGRLRVLAIAARNRSPAAPELPTVAEAGLPGFEVEQWYGVVTRANVAAAIIRKLNTGIVEAIKSPDVAQRFALDGVTPLGSTRDEFAAHINSDVRKWKKLIVEARLTLN